MLNRNEYWLAKMTVQWLVQKAKNIDYLTRGRALQYQAGLTTPPGALGIMQKITADFAGWQSHSTPLCTDVLLQAFRSNQDDATTTSMAHGQDQRKGSTPNWSQKKLSELNTIASELQSELSLTRISCGSSSSTPSTKFGNELELDEPSVSAALEDGYKQGTSDLRHLLIGITVANSNTATASTVYQALLQTPKGKSTKPLEILHTLGGLEFAALLGAYIGAAQIGVPILVNGFVGTAAALLAVQLNPSVRQWMMFSHEGTHLEQRLALRQLQAQPVLETNLKVCEQTALTTALNIVRSSLGLHQRMNSGTNHPSIVRNYVQ